MTTLNTYTNIIVNADRSDPTRTTALRNAWAREMKRRFGELTTVIKKTVAEDDCFGLNQVVVHGGPGSGNFGHAGRPGEVGGSGPGGEGKVFLTDVQRSEMYYHRSTTGKTDEILESGFIKGRDDNFSSDVYINWNGIKPTSIIFGVSKSELFDFYTNIGGWSVASNYKDTPLGTIARILVYNHKTDKLYDVTSLYTQGVKTEKGLINAFKGIVTHQITSPGHATFAFPRSQDKVAMFMRWLEQQVDRGLLQVGELPQVGEAMEGAWTNRYVFDSYKRGVIRARYEMQKAGYKVPSIEQTGGIEISMATPFHIDRLGLLYTRVFNELKGVTATMDTQISRVLSQGIADGDNPRLLARKLVATIDGTGMGELGITDTLGRYIPAARRAEMIARTEVIRAHHLATIQEYRNWAVEGVRVKAEWKTAGLTDKRTCDECKELEGHIFSLDEIEKKIPLHPMCRCVALPYIVKGVGTYGGPGSGNFGHAGRPGKVGGSSDEDVVRENTFTQDKLKFNYADITEEELKAMKEYQHGLYRSEVGGFSTLQTYLRDKTISESLRKEGVTEEKVQKYVDDISSAVAKSVIAKDSVVYRGIRNTAETFGITDISQLKVGFQFTDKAFTSTSSAYSIASRFASKLNHWEDPRILNITLDKGQSAFPMNLIGVSKEREVVLPTGSRFEVTRIFGRNIDLKVIHD